MDGFAPNLTAVGTADVIAGAKHVDHLRGVDSVGG